MPKPFQPNVLTANNLVEGHTVFLAADGWRRDIAAALVAQTPEQAEELLALGTRFVTDNEVVGAYLIDVSIGTGAPIPVSRREQIRAAGTTTIPVGPDALANAA